MNKIKQCTYTILLILTCLVASPIIFKQIWTTSAEKEKSAPVKDIEIDIHKGAEIPSQNEKPQTSEPASENTSDSSVQPATGEKATDEPATEPNTQEADPHYITFQYTEAEPSYFDDALFIGDSRTVGIYEYGTLKNADYYCDIGYSASTLYGSHIKGGALTSKLSSNQYGKIYIMLGINEVGNDIEYTMTAYRALLDEIRSCQPDAVIYLQANLHVTQLSQTSVINNAALDVLNERISQLADYEKVFYINVNPVFDDGEGNLRNELTNDGVHVFAKYYTDWCGWLCLNVVPEGNEAQN